VTKVTKFQYILRKRKKKKEKYIINIYIKNIGPKNVTFVTFVTSNKISHIECGYYTDCEDGFSFTNWKNETQDLVK
jgi:hypothetical protein